MVRETTSGLPNYTLLEQVASRPLPDHIRESELAPEFIEHQARVEEQVLSQLRQQTHAKLFMGIVDVQGSPLAIGTDDGQALLVFSHPIKALDYARVLGLSSDFGFLPSTAPDLIKLFRPFADAGVHNFTIDPCPRCEAMTSLAMEDVQAPDRLIAALATSRAAELARSKLYSDFAIVEALVARFESARDISLEAVGHITPRAKDHHVLLGQCAVMLEDPLLFDEAVSYLKFLGHSDWVSTLHAVRETGVPQLPRPRPSE